jgi:ABC-type nitrate/sulfonate/bicarbonate transport system permease component
MRLRAGGEQLIGVASPLLLLALWEAAAHVGLIDTRFFPAPSTVIMRLVLLAQTGELELHL